MDSKVTKKPNAVNRLDTPNQDPTSNGASTPKKPKLNPPETLTLITNTEIKSEFSHHDPSFARINNGSFECVPAAVLAAQRRWQMLFLRQPDHFYFSLLRPTIDQSRRKILPLVNAGKLVVNTGIRFHKLDA